MPPQVEKTAQKGGLHMPEWTPEAISKQTSVWQDDLSGYLEGRGMRLTGWKTDWGKAGGRNLPAFAINVTIVEDMSLKEARKALDDFLAHLPLEHSFVLGLREVNYFFSRPSDPTPRYHPDSFLKCAA